MSEVVKVWYRQLGVGVFIATVEVVVPPKKGVFGGIEGTDEIPVRSVGVEYMAVREVTEPRSEELSGSCQESHEYAPVSCFE